MLYFDDIENRLSATHSKLIVGFEYVACQAPSTGMIVPDMKDAALEAKNRITVTTSLGSPTRCMGYAVAIAL